MQVRDLGVMDYGECLALQRQLRDRVKAGGEEVVIVAEHPTVVTLGRRGTPEEVFDKSVPVYEIERGGKATLHGPGQLVVYPIVHLGEGNRDVRAWVRHLERFLIECLGHFGIPSRSDPERPGVWTVSTGKKIASIGIAVQSWVSTHGVALNVTIDPAEFQRLDPCGLGAAVMTNMCLEGAAVTVGEVRAWIIERAGDHFAPLARPVRVADQET